MIDGELDLSARVKIPSHVVYREFPAETVTAVAKQYGQSLADVERDVRAFCGDLLRRGLILLDPASG